MNEAVAHSTKGTLVTSMVIEPIADDRFSYSLLNVIAIDNELISLNVGNIAHTIKGIHQTRGYNLV